MNTDEHGWGRLGWLTSWVNTASDASLWLSVFIRVHPWLNAVFRITGLTPPPSLGVQRGNCNASAGSILRTDPRFHAFHKPVMVL
jgi:hypothetical protein